MHTLVRVKNAYTVMTICLIALGAALLFAPQLGLRTLCVVYGVFLIVYGVTKLSGYNPSMLCFLRKGMSS